jgi:hypothetical protein
MTVSAETGDRDAYAADHFHAIDSRPAPSCI